MKATRGSASSTFRWATTFRAPAAIVLAAVLCGEGYAQASREEVLARVYPGAAIRAERVFLNSDQMRRAREAAGAEIESALIAMYVATSGGKVVGRAYVDTHVVRTKRESLLICLDELNRVKRVEVTAFLEPPEYQASPAWYGQFPGKTLNDDLNVNRAIRPIAGATLTGAATTRAVRRVLAINQVLTGAAGVER